MGSVANSLYELSVILGIFQGNRRNVMQQKIMASDHISTAAASYSFASYTSGARYGSEPTIPVCRCQQLVSPLQLVLFTFSGYRVVLKGILEDMGAAEINDLHNTFVAHDDVI